MKKKLLCLFVLSLIILAGCGKTSDYREPERRLYISSLGFDRRGEEIRVCAEAISVADNTSGDQYSVKHYDGRGDSIDSAMYEITKNLAPSVNLSHCAILVLGEGMTGEHLDQLLKFGLENEEITHSIQIIATEEAKEFLQYNKESTNPLGFQISELLAEDIDGIGADKFSTLASVINKRERENDFFALPYFEVEDKNYLFSGTKLYKDNRTVEILSRSGTQLLWIARNEFSGGEIKLSLESRDIVAELKKARTTAKLEDGEPPKLLLRVNVKTSESEKTNKTIEETLQAEMREVITSLRDNAGIDPLQADKLIKKEDAFEIFRDAQILVECKVKGENE